MSVLTGGQLVALVATLALTPLQLRGMGNAAYAVITLSAALVGYLNFMDLGAGWALGRYLPVHLAGDDFREARDTVAASLGICLCLGGLTCTTLFTVSPGLVSQFQLGDDLRGSAEFAFRTAALLVPLSLLQGLAGNVARSLGRFNQVAVVATLNVVVLNIVWALVATHDQAIALVVITQLCISVTSCGYWIVSIHRWAPDIIPRRLPSRMALRRIMAFGALAAVGQLGIGFALSASKLALGAAVPAEEIVYFGIAFSLAVRLLVVSSNVNAVVFPRLAAAADVADSRELFRNALVPVSAVTALATAMCAVGGADLMTLWLGHDFAESSARPLMLLAFALGTLGCTSVMAAYLDARGAIAKTAVAHLVWGGATVVGVYLGAVISGVSGAAAAFMMVTFGFAGWLVHLAAEHTGSGFLDVLRPALLPLPLACLGAALALLAMPADGSLLRLVACFCGAAAGLAMSGTTRRGCARLVTGA